MDGTRLRDLDPKRVDDELLRGVWEQVRALHAARVVHGRLDASHVIVNDDGPYLVGFAAGRSSQLGHHERADVAQLLAATVGLVGNDRAVRVAAAVLGDGDVLAAFPLLQPSVVTPETRHDLGRGHGTVRGRLGELRTAGSRVLGVEPPELAQLARHQRHEPGHGDRDAHRGRGAARLRRGPVPGLARRCSTPTGGG